LYGLNTLGFFPLDRSRACGAPAAGEADGGAADAFGEKKMHAWRRNDIRSLFAEFLNLSLRKPGKNQRLKR